MSDKNSEKQDSLLINSSKAPIGQGMCQSNLDKNKACLWICLYNHVHVHVHRLPHKYVRDN